MKEKHNIVSLCVGRIRERERVEKTKNSYRAPRAHMIYCCNDLYSVN